MKVYVVLSEQGEYSEKDVWVSGVFQTEAEAQAAIDACAARRRSWEIWQDAYKRELANLLRQTPLTYFNTLAGLSLSDGQREAARKSVGMDEPPYERAERASYEEIEMGTWK